MAMPMFISITTRPMLKFVSVLIKIKLSSGVACHQDGQVYGVVIPARTRHL
jgi:hypothetical protein